MKTKIDRRPIDFENRAARRAGTRDPKFKIQDRPAFTLIELLVVISIIAVLAAFSVPVLKSLKRNQFIKQTQAEMAQLETAIDSFKATYGAYPPSNPNYNPGNAATGNQAMFSPLYFELLGTTNTGNGNYQTLDGSASISTNSITLTNAFGVSGFINCTKTGAGEDAPAAKNFLQDLKPKQIGANITNNNIATTLLLGSVGGPDPASIYNPFYPNPGSSGVNPWRYVSPGINNPGSYDLWIQLSIGGTTNLVCNWSKQIQKNSPLP
jgi:prepilin-type N-terminal cleavage/methylation domain-containing protein